MMETHDGSPDPRMDHGPTRFQRRRKAKAYKTMEGKLRYVVGRDIYLDRVEALSRCALIGRLEYVSMEKKDWLSWATEFWKPFLSYIPTISLLARGWIVFVFLENAHATEVLNRLWRVGKGSLVLDHWYVNFDPAHERVQKKASMGSSTGTTIPALESSFIGRSWKHNRPLCGA